MMAKNDRRGMMVVVVDARLIRHNKKKGEGEGRKR